MPAPQTQYDTRSALALLSDAELHALGKRTWGRDRATDRAVLERLHAPAVAVLTISIMLELDLRQERREENAR